MELLYSVFIYPLEFLMELVLKYALEITGNPAFSIIILSFIVTIFSLPVYHIAEKWQDRERDVQKKLQPKINEFKSIFKGAALNTYINTLYRQNRYHPIQAARTSFGLLIQIPFFFAAYHLLSNYSDFNGVGVFIFKDLGKPDGLISIGAFTANILPFLMTGINLISAAVYGKKTTSNEKFQLYGIALLFLAVLYDASSALLIYWTCNNLFSLFKNIAYGFIYKNGIITEKSRILFPAAGNLFSVIRKKRPDCWVMFTLLLISALSFYSIYERHGSVFDNALPAILLTFAPLLIVLFFLVLFVTGLHPMQRMISIIPASDKDVDRIFRLSVLSFVLLAFIAVPLAVLSTGSESDFEGTLFYFLNYLIVFSIIFMGAFFIIYSILPEKAKWIFSLLTVFVLFYSILNVFIFTGNYGDMSHFVFNETIEITDLDIMLNVAAGFFACCLPLYVFSRRKYSVLRSLLFIIIISLTLFSIKESRAYSLKRVHSENNAASIGKHEFKFSKKGKNVVIIMLDRFIGGYMPMIIELMPELKNDLDGFVLYENSMSPASYTLGGVPAIMGGWEYTVHEVNRTRKDIPLTKKLDESARILPYNFDKAGFDVTIFQNDFINWSDKVSWLDRNNRENLGSSVIISPDYPKYRELWLEKYEKEVMQEDNSIRNKLLAFGIFRASPVYLRLSIYDSGDWHIEKEDVEEYKKPDERKYISFNEKSRHKRDTNLKYYAMLDLLPDFSIASDKNKDQFIYLANNMTHEPHSINSNFEFETTGKVSYPRNIYDKFGKNLNALKHLYADGAAIRMVNDWLAWMKENGVYDNTRIIMVSDHGRDVYNPFFKQQKIPGGRSKNHPAYFNNLMLVKDFDSRGELTVDEQFMSSADVPAIAMSRIIDGMNPYTNKKIAMPENKFPFYAYDIQWRIEKQEEFNYKFHEGYEIKEGDVSQPKNWKVIKGN